VEPHDSAARYTALGVECIQGEARIASPWTVKSARQRARTLSTRAHRDRRRRTGLGAADPRHRGDPRAHLGQRVEFARAAAALVVLGGGPSSCELAQAFARLGAAVTQVEMLPRLPRARDPEVPPWWGKFRKDGMTFW